MEGKDGCKGGRQAGVRDREQRDQGRGRVPHDGTDILRPEFDVYTYNTAAIGLLGLFNGKKFGHIDLNNTS